MNPEKCQQIRLFIPKKDKLLLDNFNVSVDIFRAEEKFTANSNMSFLISCLRGCFIASDSPALVPTWAGCRALLSQSNVLLMNVGFLPYIPRPVTDYSTVYTAMHNFMSMLTQLDQPSVPLFCDEGVYRIIADIYLQRKEVFKNLVPMLGGFHMGKAVKHCIGKIMRGSGIEDALTESVVFGPSVVESVISGSHYVRSLRGLRIVYDVLQNLKWEAFWASKDKESHGEVLQTLSNYLRYASLYLEMMRKLPNDHPEV